MSGDGSMRPMPATTLAPALQHPLFDAWREHAAVLADPSAVGVERLEALRVDAVARDGIARPTLRAQTPSLLADGLHYETRIAERHVLATRERNPHDVFNALVWLRHPAIKHALNARQVADIAVFGPKQRTRGQCAMTQFDEAGGIVWIADPGLLALWDAHDWQGLFLGERDAWGTRIAVTVFGHALLEHVGHGMEFVAAKTIVAQVSPAALAAQPKTLHGLVAAWPDAEAAVARAIATGALLGDPQQPRPLPLSGLPGWHRDGSSAAFYASAPCFRPLRAGRRYQPPLMLPD